MLRVIPLVIIGNGFLLHLLANMIDKPFDKLFFWLSFLMIPASIGACIHIAIAETNTGLESIMTGLFYVFAAIFVLILVLFMLGVLTKSLEDL